VIPVVVDTNILVSGLWKPTGSASLVISQIVAGNLVPCYDHRIVNEYDEVLRRPKFKFSALQVGFLLEAIFRNGVPVVADPLPDVIMGDEDDRPFFEVAKTCGAPHVTGNIKYYPSDSVVYALSDFCRRFLIQ